MNERLTKRIDNKTYFIIKTEGNDFYSDGEDLTFNYYDKEVQKILDRLAKYEDLEQQGLIVRLPHKIGEEVTFLDRFCLNYGLYGRAIKTGTIAEIGFTITKEGQRTWQYVIECYDKVYKENDIKSRYFCSQENLCTSKEEAEKKLKELKGEE